VSRGLRDLEDNAWGPSEESVPLEGHVLANGACAGFAERSGVFFQAARIDAQVLIGGSVLRTAEPARTCVGLAQVRRLLAWGPLEIAHVVFAPDVPRPLLLGLVRLRNTGTETLVLDYTELWGVSGGRYRAAAGAAERRSDDGTRALVDLSAAIRSHAPERLAAGLALDLRVPVPPGQTRQLAFGYAAAPPGEDAGHLTHAWHGDVAHELERTSAAWRERLRSSGHEADAIAAYRVAALATAVE
jgi:hypothetical protein